MAAVCMCPSCASARAGAEPSRITAPASEYPTLTANLRNDIVPPSLRNSEAFPRAPFRRPPTLEKPAIFFRRTPGTCGRFTRMDHQVVSHEEWIEARRKLLDLEKSFTRQGEEMSRLQRALPWERVAKEYAFEGAGGRESLADLFDGRSQLVVYHFMFHPDDKAGCPHCSLRADAPPRPRPPPTPPPRP